MEPKFAAGFGALSWAREHGGRELPAVFQEAFDEEEAMFETPEHHETLSVTLNLVAPAILRFGTTAQRREFIPRFLRTTELCCQLFSEPGAGSDLAVLSTRAVRDGDDWVISGQKTWSSGARFAEWGELVCRTGPSKHADQTAFVIPTDTSGVTVVPIRQMTGGSSFNEVFLDEVRVPDRMRLGAEGEGWTVVLTTLGFERGSSGRGREVGGTWAQVRDLAQWLEVTDDAVVRQRLARLYTLDRVRAFHAVRLAGLVANGGVPGPEGSISKLLWTQWMTEVGEVAASLLGPRLAADSGEWGTYAWAKHVLGACGYRIAGGSDEIQRSIAGERALELPREPSARDRAG